MNKKMILKICIDAVMFVLFLLLMSEFLIKEAHLWIGITSAILFLLHNALNWRWYKNLFKGRYTILRIIQTAVNSLLWINLILCIVSGILILPEIFVWYESGVKMHLVTSAWAFILLSVHLGLHWGMFVGLTKKVVMHKMVQTILKWIFRVIVCVICIYGIYVFIERKFWEEMFLVIDYQKEYDYSKIVVLYLVESVALSVVFTSMTYYVKKIGLHLHHRTKQKEEN